MSLMNIHDIARLAGVSVATVSRALNTPDKVKEQTLQKIIKVMEEHNYTTNPFARNLKKEKTQNILLIIPNDVNPIIFEIAKGAEEVLEQHNYVLTIFNTRKSIAKQSSLLDLMFKKRHTFFMDGLILFGSGTLQQGYEQSLKNVLNIPTVAIDSGPVEKHIDTVYFDEAKSIMLTISYLAEKGYRSIGIITGNANFSLTKRRLDEVYKYCNMFNITLDEQNIVHGIYDSMESSYSLVRKLIHSGTRPEVIFAFNDILAIGAMKYLLENNFRIPEDMAVISCDNIPMASFYHPGITTVNLPGYDIGMAAARLLLHRIKNPQFPIQNIMFPPALIIRESC